MILFALLILANACEIIGFNRACGFSYKTETGYASNGNDQVDDSTKMIFWKFGAWSEKTFGAFWSKPLYSCPTCMASVHGFIPFWFTYLSQYEFTPMAVAYWAFYTLTLSGVATLLNK